MAKPRVTLSLGMEPAELERFAAVALRRGLTKAALFRAMLAAAEKEKE